MTSGTLGVEAIFMVSLAGNLSFVSSPHSWYLKVWAWSSSVAIVPDVRNLTDFLLEFVLTEIFAFPLLV